MRTHDWLLGIPMILLAVAGCDGSGGSGTGGTGGTGAAGATGGSGGSGGTTTPTGGGGAGGTGAAGGTGGSGGTTTTGQGGAPDGFCRTPDDCDPARGDCYAPGTVPMCGACMIPDVPCGSDTDCAAVGTTSICGTEGCLCEPGCVPGCTADADCEAWETCAASHHCEPKACAQTADCPPNFDCIAAACTRKQCKTDLDCDDFCVLNQCYDALGTCTFPPA